MITVKPRKYNEGPIFKHLKEGTEIQTIKGEKLVVDGPAIINSIGGKNMGLEKWKKTLPKVLKQVPLILNVRGESIEEIQKLVDELSPIIKDRGILEINFSCPNDAQGVLDLEEGISWIQSIKNSMNVPLFVKLSPEYSENELMRFVEETRSNISGITIFNTIPVSGALLKKKQAGLSGSLLYPYLVKYLKKLREIYPTFDDLPIIATGGINNGKKAWEMLHEYHALPALLTAFLSRGPSVFKEINSYILEKTRSLDLKLEEILYP